MKSQLIAIVAAVLLVGCGPSISIHKAAEEGNIEADKQHLADGADVNAKNRSGATAMHSTPLCEAAGGGHKEVAELLIERGADVNAKNNLGGTPLHNAANGGHKEIVELLITNGTNVNARTPRMVGWHTPLHRAAPMGHKEIIELLIAKGADVNAKDKTGGRQALVDPSARCLCQG
jgi:cytohesin